MSKSYSEISRDGFWSNNVGLVQILGLCPLLATSTSTVNGLGLGLATTLALLFSNLVVSLIRNLVKPEVRIPVFVMVIAAVVTVIELSMNAWFHELYKILGIFVPLIVTNCALLGRAEAFAFKNSPDRAALDGLTMGLGFTAVLVALGTLREMLGNGTILAQAQMMFGELGKMLTITLVEDYHGFLLAILPPGAFIGLGLLIACKNIIDERNKRIAALQPKPILLKPEADSATA
jgi:electron transport complex protein RnfE